MYSDLKPVGHFNGIDVRGEGDGGIEGGSLVSILSNWQENESIYSDKKVVGVRTELDGIKG